MSKSHIKDLDQQKISCVLHLAHTNEAFMESICQLEIIRDLTAYSLHNS